MSPILISWLALAVAILCEVTGSSFLQRSEQFTRPIPTLIMVVCYVVSFYLLSVALKMLPLGTAYAIWAGVGIVLTALIGLVMFRQTLDTPALLGIGLIITGVLIINLFSRTAGGH